MNPHPTIETRAFTHIPGLHERTDSSSKLYVRGTPKSFELLKRLPVRGLGIVGTRNPQPHSIRQTQKWVRELGTSELIVISGFARGIDASAHSASIEAKIPTIAILGAGLDVDYPRENRQLRDRILHSGGLLVSEFEPEHPPYPGNFPKRNRIIAKWSQCTLVVEAKKGSGALLTAKWAQELDRTVFAAPCAPGDPIRTGNQELLDGKHATPFWGPYSLGQIWLSLTALKTNAPGHRQNHRKPLKNPIQDEDEDAQTLRRWAEEADYTYGGVETQTLFTRALNSGWDGVRFYTALQKCTQLSYFINKNRIPV